MSRIQGIFWTLLAALCTTLPATRLYAVTAHLDDLDSLVHLSTDVIEVEVTRSSHAEGIGMIEAKVTLVHKGGFKKGEIIAVTNVDAYRKAEEDVWQGERLASGDRLALFVVPVKPREPTEAERTRGRRLGRNEETADETARRLFGTPANVVIYATLPGGMRFIQGGHVFAFLQWENPGPLVAHVATDSSGVPLLTVEHFREHVRDSLCRTDEWAHLVEAKLDDLHTPRMLTFLGYRAAQPGIDRDYFSERICLRFAESHDVNLLSRALLLTRKFDQTSILQCGFGTAVGRDFLLAKVTDEKEPMPARLRYADALAGAGDVYRSTFSHIGTNGWSIAGKADEGNSGYLTRIAKAAVATRKHEELCESLVRCLDFFCREIVQNKPAPMMADLRGALAALKELYDTQPSQSLQFAIETATSNVPESHEKLSSPCGRFISILRAVDPTKFAEPEKPSLVFGYTYWTDLSGREAELHLSVVLVHQGTKKRYVLPASLQIRGWSMDYRNPTWMGEGGSNSVPLPKELAPGRTASFCNLVTGTK